MANYKSKANNSKTTAKGNTRKHGANDRNYKKRSEVEQISRDTDNDPGWYARNDVMLTAAASFPYAYPVGSTVDLNNPILNTLAGTGSKYVVPGLMTLAVSPAFGRSDNGQSALNVAAQAVYSKVRHTNSGARNYNAPDLMVYLICMDQVYSYINYLMRAYGMATLFAQRNRYLYDALLLSQGINPNSLRRNLANYRAAINVLIDKAAQFAVPATMPVFRRHAMLYAGLYAEGETVKDQLYMYVPDAFYKFSLDSDGAGQAELSPCNWTQPHQTHSFVGEGVDFGVLLDYGEDMIRRLVESEDFGLISGDILHAYASNVLTLQTLPEVYPIVPETNLNVLEQIKNATCIKYDVAIGNIQQDATKAYLVHTAHASYNKKFEEPGQSEQYYTGQRVAIKALMENKLVSTIRSNPTPSDSMEITRLTLGAINYGSDNSTSSWVDLIYGAEIPIRAHYFGYSYDTADGQWKLFTMASSYTDAHYVGETANLEVNEVRRYARMSSFKFHPCDHVLVFKDGVTAPAVSFTDGFMIFDVDNFTVLSNDNLKQLHEIAIMGLFNVDILGKL